MGSNPTSPIAKSADHRAKSGCYTIIFIAMRKVILILAALVLSRLLSAGEIEVFTGRPTGVIKFVQVDYPPKLRGYAWNGKGLFLLRVNPKTGDVDEVKVIKSTGHVLLNEFAAKAFFQWKFQPGGATQVQVPVEFYARGFSRDLH